MKRSWYKKLIYRTESMDQIKVILVSDDALAMSIQAVYIIMVAPMLFTVHTQRLVVQAPIVPVPFKNF